MIRLQALSEEGIMRHQLNVIDFPDPYTDPQRIEQIAAYTRALAQNELPAFQVDVGADYSLAGTFAVQKAIEMSLEECYGDNIKC